MDLLDYLLLPVMNRIERMEKKIMTALEDVTAAVDRLTTEEAKFLTDIAGQLSGSVSDEQAEALAATINQRAADLTNADPGTPPTPPVVPGTPPTPPVVPGA